MKTKLLWMELVILGLFSAFSSAQGGWSLQTNPTMQSGESMQFVSATEGWIGLTSNQLLHTTNSGNTWNVVTPNITDESTGINAPGSRLCFVTPTTGWALKTLTVPGNSAGAILYKTIDGGATWNGTVLSTTLGDAGIQVQFTDATHGWVLIYNMSNGTPTFLKTVDGGNTWNPTNGGGIFCFVSNSVGYAFAAGPSLLPPYTIYKTTDGGANWTPQYVDNTEGELSAMQFTDANNGWIVGSNGKIFHTTNGGANWTKITNSGFNVNYKHSALSFISNTTGWIASQNNSNGTKFTLSTTDGGATWSTQTLPFSYQVYSMDFWDANNGWAAADYGPIAKYSAGSITYSNATLNGPWFFYRDITPIDPFNDNLNYFVFDGNGNVYDFNGFSGPWSGTYTVSPSGALSGVVSNGAEGAAFSGQLTSTTEGTLLIVGQNFRIHKIANPGALQDKIVGVLSTDNCGDRNVMININSNGQITSATGLIGPVAGRVYTDLGVYIGHMTTGEPDGWHELSIMGYYSNNNLTGQLGLEWQSCTNGFSGLVRMDNLGVEDQYFADKNITVYPNPNNGSFYFDIKEPTAKLQIEIYNMMGQKVYESTNTDVKVTNEVRFEPQGSGLYFVKISDGKSVFNEKIIIH